MENFSILIQAAGQPGTIERLQKIASLGLGVRSEAAARVLYKRARRVELMEKGFTFEEAKLIVNLKNE
jgi:hypothetical protein